jgi:RimJ/RimL family protein N-acetyltransferase
MQYRLSRVSSRHLVVDFTNSNRSTLSLHHRRNWLHMRPFTFPALERMIQMTNTIFVPRIQTERLTLRGLTEGDIPFLLEHFGKDEINEYTSDSNVTSTEEAEELYLKYIAPRPNLFRLGLLMKETGQLIGTLGFYGIDRENKRAIIGVDLMKKHWGKGLMTEALRALVKYGFEEMDLNRIEATSDPRNLRSLRLMERCSFKKEGVLRQRFFYKGSFHDDVVYSLLKEEWKGTHS